MSYQIYIGDQSFSSWSLRGWLMLEKFGLPYEARFVGLYSGTFQEDLAGLAPARLVPVLKTPEGTVIGETQAIAEELNSRHPELQMWPEAPEVRAFARWISAEMHAGFTTLRGECPMQLLHQYEGFPVSDALRADLDRLELLWTKAREEFGAEGPWLFGRYSLADCFYAPVAARIAGFNLPVGVIARDYVATTLADPAFQSWRAAGLQKSYDPEPYAMDLPKKPWPGV